MHAQCNMVEKPESYKRDAFGKKSQKYYQIQVRYKEYDTKTRNVNEYHEVCLAFTCKLSPVKGNQAEMFSPASSILVAFSILGVTHVNLDQFLEYVKINAEIGAWNNLFLIFYFDTLL